MVSIHFCGLSGSDVLRIVAADLRVPSGTDVLRIVAADLRVPSGSSLCPSLRLRSVLVLDGALVEAEEDRRGTSTVLSGLGVRPAKASSAAGSSDRALSV